MNLILKIIKYFFCAHYWEYDTDTLLKLPNVLPYRCKKCGAKQVIYA